MSKCLAFKDVAFSRDIRPPFECNREKSSKVCLKQIGDGAADVITLDATAAILARKNQNMRPILKEQYGNEKDLLAVAVVNKNSTVKGLFSPISGSINKSPLLLSCLHSQRNA
uniref:Transferrin n=1 Tax=Cacopsylla melanoneura TaxID=428564 RepID=A0A8D8QDC2_9HEMI